MSIDLATRYLGLGLKNPLVVAACPLTRRLDSLRRFEDAGASAVVLPSLFEEQVAHEILTFHRMHSFGMGGAPESMTYSPEMDQYNTGHDSYLQGVRPSCNFFACGLRGSWFLVLSRAKGVPNLTRRFEARWSSDSRARKELRRTKDELNAERSAK